MPAPAGTFTTATISTAPDADVRTQLGTILDEVTAERNAAVGKVDEDAKAAILAAGGVIRELTP
ncbi:MAG: hypothetical protein ACWGNV_14310, partial [Bacteroidales bacterium]